MSTSNESPLSGFASRRCLTRPPRMARWAGRFRPSIRAGIFCWSMCWSFRMWWKKPACRSGLLHQNAP